MSQRKVIAVIPARMGSSRFPGKPLAQILDLPMIEHVRRRVMLCKAIDEVVVATCDQEIVDTVREAGGKAVMTADSHERCTDRVAEAMQELNGDIVVIVQGDEPLLMPIALNHLVNPFTQDPTINCVNLISKITTPEDLADVDIVKAILAETGDVMYFTRAAAPYQRVEGQRPMFRQTGLSAFSHSFLTEFTALTPTQLEIIESVDFLRILGHGYKIRASIYGNRTIGVDRPDDVLTVENEIRDNPEQSEIYNRIMVL
ncbi:3-deoxy-manno-octulosonate cytidylyltransferase [Kiloniella laminariae]|uniref:3-deoxy-manno-octulosonate cytidylyltransferase n=1 Tax=Kiloniella laminariae TaxID=454162 RepID=A0ABT4LMM9_9PROT|nr:3-deoxy-manno-octulosonate cytidylyltransferase [Kiloniella laminariae]MCZ4282329.1 3-deoxy-manno-octulosonate cytidylyltransferase [Kiloniella laminariae]